MGFGNNPFVAKAQATEQKARDAGDVGTRERTWRDAGRLWERAAEREMDPKRRATYEQNAERARTEAETPEPPAALPDPEVLAAHGVTIGTGKPN